MKNIYDMSFNNLVEHTREKLEPFNGSPLTGKKSTRRITEFLTRFFGAKNESVLRGLFDTKTTPEAKVNPDELWAATERVLRNLYLMMHGGSLKITPTSINPVLYVIQAGDAIDDRCLKEIALLRKRVIKAGEAQPLALCWHNFLLDAEGFRFGNENNQNRDFDTFKTAVVKNFSMFFNIDGSEMDNLPISAYLSHSGREDDLLIISYLNKKSNVCKT